MTSPAPTRIAFVITELDPGGAEQALVELVTRLDPEEFLPRVFTLRSGGALAETVRAREIEVIELGARHRFDLGVVSRLAKALREFSQPCCRPGCGTPMWRGPGPPHGRVSPCWCRAFGWPSGGGAGGT